MKGQVVFFSSVLYFGALTTTAFACDCCYARRTDYCVLSGYINSSSTGYCNCILSAPRTSRDFLHPGLFTDQRSGKLLVSLVLPDSPASQSGILPGDEILSVNGHTILDYSPGNRENPWTAEGSPNLTRVQLSRANRTFGVTMKLVPMSSLADRLWTSRGAPVASEIWNPTNIRTAVKRHQYSDYTFGLEVALEYGRLMVSDTFAGGPASRAGIVPGAQIAAVDDIAILNLSSPGSLVVLQENLISPKPGSTIKLTIASRDRMIDAPLTAWSWSRSLKSAALLAVSPNVQVASFGPSESNLASKR
jgi:predicted metalloprotease with PDZ domain